jgi:hypothetical protein
MEIKKTYSNPQLTALGTLQALTLAGMGSALETDTSESFMGSGMGSCTTNNMMATDLMLRPCA